MDTLSVPPAEADSSPAESEGNREPLLQVKNLEVKINKYETQISQVTTQLNTCSDQRDSCDAASKTLKTDLQNCKSSGSSGNGAASACQTQLAQLQKQCTGNNTQV